MTVPDTGGANGRMDSPGRREPGVLLRLAYLVVAVLISAAGASLLVYTSCRLLRPLPEVPALPPAPPEIAYPGAVRVLLRKSAEAFSVEAPHGAIWTALDAEGPRSLGDGRGPWTVGVGEEGIRLDDRLVPENEVFLQTRDGGIVLDGTPYRGDMVLQLGSSGLLSVLNDVDAEEYLRSVVASEVYSRWPLEALMAQAVTARTFMLYAVAGKGYLTLADMAYRGRDVETRSVNLATQLTRGIILTYEDRVLPAYFQSTCGGHTAPVEKVFAEEPIPPLGGVECLWCSDSPWFGWKATVQSSDLTAALTDRGVGEIREIAVEGAGADGYARYILVNGTVKLSAAAFRRAVGGRLLKSTCFQAAVSGSEVTFTGRGFGHGVGLCQWGARGLADAGRTWQEVLLTYYPGAQIRKAW
jgi:stage II sporulation protein D